MSKDLVTLFERIGLSSEKAAEAASNKKVAPLLENAIKSVSAVKQDSAPLFLHLASNAKGNAADNIPFIAQAINDSKLLNADQVNAAIKYINSLKGDIETEKFNEACGVGVLVTLEDISRVVKAVFEQKKEELDQKKHSGLGVVMGAVKQELRWADSALVKQEIDKLALKIYGERPDLKKKSGSTKNLVKSDSSSALGSIEERAQSTKFVFEGELLRLHKPGENPQIKPELMEQHLKRTGGKVITRFPPEPNGFLHIGHAKAININFGYAKAHGGTTFLRYDDTNPEAEEQIYFDSILETVRWLGYEPSAITYSSDHFQRLYELAVELVKRDKAYVCHCTGEEIHEMRGGDAKGPRSECKHRNRPIQESLDEFEKMKNGQYKEGEAILRMKMDMQHPSPQFWDLVAYRILYTEHMRSGSDWCIYPTYDYTHCLCDSFEDITHSMCTTEFVMSRESYYWLVDALELYKPVQWEYGRLKLTNTVLSKRKLNKLVEGKYVDGWEDPRLYTLQALKRRGFTPQAINAFVRELGVTTANSTIPVERLENYVREHLNQVAPRVMVVIDPILVTIENLKEDHLEYVEAPNHPKEESMGFRKLPFTNKLYIDRSDFKVESDPNFYRLTLNGCVGLLNVPYPITCTRVVTDDSGKVTELYARYEVDSKLKPKTWIQWVAKAENSPVPVTVRDYSNLFLHADPSNKEQVPGGWLSDINPDSLTVYENSVADLGVVGAKELDRFQFLRVGYFCVDRDSKEKLVFNRTVSLKEDKNKN